MKAILFRETGEELDVARALGIWGRIPHDARIRSLYLKLKRQGELKERPQDNPLAALFGYLRDKAGNDKRSALSLAYISEYLRHFPGEVGDVVRALMMGSVELSDVAGEPIAVAERRGTTEVSVENKAVDFGNQGQDIASDEADDDETLIDVTPRKSIAN
jgi:hypothetical protein